MSDTNPRGQRDIESLIDTDVPDKLHIGGKVSAEGWKVLDVQPGKHVDFVADLRDLSGFGDESFDLIYGSHVLEHFGYTQDLPIVLKSLHRIIRPGGRLLVSVPDLEILSRLYLDKSNSLDERFQIMRMMFGGQMDSYDFHFVGLDLGLLTYFLSQAGFREAYRVPYFDIFADSSQAVCKDVLISLNVVAFK